MIDTALTLRKHYRDREGGSMSRDRRVNREKVKEAKREDRLDRKNAFGNSDLTPFEAVLRMRGESVTQNKYDAYASTAVMLADESGEERDYI